uniref:Uncharacterized protein n=1 Tax=Rhizochromulina marina TaxID=1034831 RepID=A0A7S2SMX5_9STRA
MAAQCAADDEWENLSQASMGSFEAIGHSGALDLEQERVEHPAIQGEPDTQELQRGISVAEESELSEFDTVTDGGTTTDDGLSSMHSDSEASAASGPPAVHPRMRRPAPFFLRSRRQQHRSAMAAAAVAAHVIADPATERHLSAPSRRKQRRWDNDRLVGLPAGLLGSVADGGSIGHQSVCFPIPEYSSAFDELLEESNARVRDRFMRGYNTMKRRPKGCRRGRLHASSGGSIDTAAVEDATDTDAERG